MSGVRRKAPPAGGHSATTCGAVFKIPRLVRRRGVVQVSRRPQFEAAKLADKLDQVGDGGFERAVAAGRVVSQCLQP